MKKIYGRLAIGSPLEDGVLVGPLIDAQAFAGMTRALETAQADGGRVTGGGRALADQYPGGWYATPAIVEMPSQSDIVRHETRQKGSSRSPPQIDDAHVRDIEHAGIAPNMMMLLDLRTIVDRHIPAAEVDHARALRDMQVI